MDHASKLCIQTLSFGACDFQSGLGKWRHRVCTGKVLVAYTRIQRASAKALHPGLTDTWTLVLCQSPEAQLPPFRADTPQNAVLGLEEFLESVKK